MAKPVSEEELQLKKRARRRLIGAIALVAAVAAVLPMVLDSEPKSSSQEINIQIPSPDAKSSGVSKAAPVPLTKAAPEKSAPEKAPAEKAEPKAAEKAAPEKAEPKAAEMAPAKAEVAEKPAAKAPDNPNDTALFPVQRGAKDKPAEKAVAKAPEKTVAKAPEKTAEKVAEKAPEKPAEKPAVPKAAAGSFFIQVIALSEPDKAKQVQQQIAGAGVRAYTEVVASGAGKVTRVRAGPFASREEADRAQAKLQGIGLDGKVAAY